MAERDILNELLERVVRIETKIDGYNNLKNKLDETYRTAMKNEEDVRDIKSNQRWLWKAFVGAIIASFVTYFLKWGV